MSAFVFDGLATVDVQVSRDVVVERRADGVVLRSSQSGPGTFIPTDSSPDHGAKVNALAQWPLCLNDPILFPRSVGGGAVRAGAALAERLPGNSDAPVVRLMNSGSPCPELERLCEQTGLRSLSFARQATPVNLIIPGGPDRTIIRGRTAVAPPRLDDRSRAALGRVAEQATAFASVSSMDAALTAASLGVGVAARHYFQPTGSLAPDTTSLLMLSAHEVICNFDEWKRLGRDAGLEVPDAPEDSPEAPEAAAALLRALRRCGCAGVEAAVCTLGRSGAVVADWQEEALTFVGLARTEDDPRVPTPTGAGHRFLAEWIFLRETWSRQGHLLHPIAATAVRATHAVAQALGLRRDRYDVRPRPC
jgi:hypothetical protein